MVMLSTCCSMLDRSALVRSICLKRISTIVFHRSIDETAGPRVISWMPHVLTYE
jgi:hypothetical protein